MMTRRDLLVTGLASLIMPRYIWANVTTKTRIFWPEFYSHMNRLADSFSKDETHLLAVEEECLAYLENLDVSDTTFINAVNEAYETGNQYWLWQRMIKQPNLNGGILTIESSQFVQLHDHPGATGILRVTSGEVEIWQFDEINEKNEITTLKRTSHRLLKAGDTAILKPSSGNIHALQAVSKECSMLDFFIPPYKRSQRSWYEPIDNAWFEKQEITCKKISQQNYMDA